MKKLFTYFCVLGTSVLGVFGLTGCESSDKIVLAEVTHSVFYAPQYIAASEGFFEDQGLEVEILLASGADAVMATLISGEAQIGLMGPEASIYVYEQGLTDYAINFAQLTQKDGAFIVSRDSTEKTSFELSNLSNKSILGGRNGGVPCMSLLYVLQQAGLDAQLDTPSAEVNVRTDIDFAAMAGSFYNGEADYTTLFEPTASMAEKEGYGFVVGAVGDYTDSLAYTCYSAKSSFINGRYDDVVAFTKAIQKAQTWVYEHTDEEVATSLYSYFSDTDYDILVSSIARYRSIDAWALTPELTESEFEYLQDIMINAGELTKYTSYVDLVDSSIFKKI
ncbi:MAG: ABC transporter substrate-binding protein [bacterium]